MVAGEPQLPSLAGAEWLGGAAVRRLFEVLGSQGDEARIVGGAVRDALMGRPVREIDFAVNAAPDAVERLAAAGDIKVVPTGRDHGTLTLVVDGAGFEVTSLREDVSTDGRRAVVRFGTDWRADALRRDFTINSLSVDAAGRVHDPLAAYPDVLARRVRFIGDADRRIAEDRLRALRFFRFHAQLGEGPLDSEGLAATVRARHDLAELSAERVGQEMRKLTLAPHAPATLEAMSDCGILCLVLAGVAYLPQFRRLVEGAGPLGIETRWPVRLAAAGCWIEEDVLRLAERLRLSNAERDEMLGALRVAADLRPSPREADLKRALYRSGPTAFRNGLALAFARRGGAIADWRNRLSLADRWAAPAFPLSGRDIMAAGVAGGPQVGAALRRLEELWIDRDFSPNAAELLAELRRFAAAG